VQRRLLCDSPLYTQVHNRNGITLGSTVLEFT